MKSSETKPKDEITLERIKKKIELSGINSLTPREASALNKFRKIGSESDKKDAEQITFNLKNELRNIIPEIFKAYVDALKNGKGTAKTAAAKDLREWASSEGVFSENNEPVECNFIEIESDEKGNIVPIKTA